MIRVHINGDLHSIRGRDALLSLSDYLRRRRGMIGTKIVCSEGDCGACSVLVARLDRSGDPAYRPIDACITFMFQLDRAHVITVEGLAEPDRLHPVQQAMVDGHGSQCGFCTPGFVVTMADVCERARADGRDTIDAGELRYALTGNLCRCTGYIQIVKAGCAVDPAQATPLNERYPVAPMRQAIAGDTGPVRIVGEGIDLFIPQTVDEAVRYLSETSGARVVCGATDIGVQVNKEKVALDRVVYIGGIESLGRIAHDNGQIVLGATATWSDVLAFVRDEVPPFAEMLDLFGAPQIRNAGTVGGNVVNASPIADSLPLLFVTDAELKLVSASGERTVAIADFYRGYKDLDLEPGELLTEVRMTRPTPRHRLRLYKVSRRRDLDISTFTAAILLRLDGETIAEAAMAYGGVGPVVLRLPRTEAAMRGQPLSEPTMRDAGAIAVDEITPISDVRGSADYRRELARTILLKMYHDTIPGDAVAST